MTNRWDALDKGTIHILGGQGKTAQDFIRLLRTVYNLKLMNYLFLEFSIYYFQTTVDCRSLKPWKVKLQIRGSTVWSLEKEMATHSSIPAWKIPWTEEPGGLQFTGSQRVGHAWGPGHTRTHTREAL